MADGSGSGSGGSEPGKAGMVRIGVGARLFGALAFNGLVAFLIGLGAYIAFDGLHAGITKVTSEQFPAVVASAKLERQHQRIMRTLEQLALSEENFGRETIKQGLADQLDGYDRLLAELDSADGRQAQRIAGLKLQRDEILRLRDAIDRGVAARIAARRALADRTRDVRRMADALAEPALRGVEDAGVQRWLAMAERLLFLIASVHQAENSFALARLADSAAAQLAALDGSVPAGDVSDRLARLAEGMRSVVEGDRSVFRQRQAELQASEMLNGLVDRANQVSLVNTGLNTGIFVEQTKAAEESRQQVIEVSTTYTRLFFASVGVVVLGMVLSVLYVRRKVLARLWAVSEAIRDRTGGGRAEVPVTGADEIGQLARALRFYIQETEDKSAALRRNEQWLRTVLEAAPVPLVISGRTDGQIRFVNRRAADLFEVDEAGELLGRPAASVWYVPQVRDEFVRDVFTSGIALDVETELVTQSGRRLWGLLSGIAFEFQGEEVLLSSVVDITRRREAEELLRRTQAFLDAVIDNVPSVLYVLDGDSGRVVLWNRAAEDCFGTRRADIENRTLAEVLGPETGRALAGGDPGSMRSLGVEELVLPRHGENAVFALQRHPFEWSGDGRCRIICVANDITASRRAREELRQAKERAERADAAKTEFLATVSHEMRTPLNGILGLCRLLLTGQLHAGERRYAMSIMRCGHGLLDQVNDILDLRKIEDGKLDLDPAPCALLPVLEEVVATVEGLANEKGIDLDLDIAPEVPELVVVDRQRLRQILVNLVGNAVKFTERGGVDLRVDIEPAPERSGSGEMLRLAVRDTGIGIPADRRAAIFEKLEQADPTIARRFGGSGLGLAIVRHLLDAMQGSIRVDSAEGLGSVFTVTIPLQRVIEPALPARPGRLLPISRVRSLALLLVEDDAINREVALGLLSDAGHRITVAETGEKALELATRRRFDAILLDIRLPDIDGPEVARRIRALEDGDRAAVPIVAVTANVFAADRARYIASGIDAVIEKPIFPERLMHLLSNAVAARSDGDEETGAGSVPVEPSARPPVVEDDVNEEILERYIRSLGPARFTTIRGLLLESAQDGLPRLTAVDSSDEEIEDIAHRLAGAASHFGLTGFVGLMRAVEDGMREGRRAEAQELAATAESAFSRGLAAMDAVRGVLEGV
ncbi:histidine kinase [Azospirillum sp. TSH7]|uniref:PAS domain-containing hybrid sensor histidine kinase/response regulator n=1 Tax=unclassified Azospirillum TaxID=2630922 RepID=UPI000D61E8A4|nr:MULTISPECIES: PAS domain-containing hybrid sensor histidine kinase/response regulator [unclassified Azospirillum]PWC60466.1 histidine kinase [Azospirillum sp. TSH7]PWC69993.1 histidine kinase [Azospirillum sp. TSH20]